MLGSEGERSRPGQVLGRCRGAERVRGPSAAAGLEVSQTKSSTLLVSSSTPSPDIFHPPLHSSSNSPLQSLSSAQYRRNGQGRCERECIRRALLAPVHGQHELTIIFNSKARSPCTYRPPPPSASLRRPSTVTFRSHWIRGMAAGGAPELSMGAVPYFFETTADIPSSMGMPGFVVDFLSTLHPARLPPR